MRQLTTAGTSHTFGRTSICQNKNLAKKKDAKKGKKKKKRKNEQNRKEKQREKRVLFFVAADPPHSPSRFNRLLPDQQF